MAGFWQGAGAGAIAGVGNIVGSVLSASMQNNYNEQAYERQRADALEQWRRQNAYDSPAAQMQRFREAGLNPDLIYGQMAQGSTMDSNASLSQVAPDFSQVGSVMANAVAQARVSNAQADLLETQADDLRNRSPYLVKELQSKVDNLDSQTAYQNIVNQFEGLMKSGQLVSQDLESQISLYLAMDLFAQLSHKFESKTVPEPLQPYILDDGKGGFSVNYGSVSKFGKDLDASLKDDMYNIELWLKRNENRILEMQGNELELNTSMFTALSDRFGLNTASIIRYLLNLIGGVHLNVRPSHSSYNIGTANYNRNN